MQIASCKTLILSVCTLVYAYSICPSAHGQQDHSSVLIENVTLIDGTGRPPLSNAFVLILGNKIAEVSTCPIEVPGKPTAADIAAQGDSADPTAPGDQNAQP